MKVGQEVFRPFASKTALDRLNDWMETIQNPSQYRDFRILNLETIYDTYGDVEKLVLYYIYNS